MTDLEKIFSRIHKAAESIMLLSEEGMHDTGHCDELCIEEQIKANEVRYDIITKQEEILRRSIHQIEKYLPQMSR